MDNNRSVSQKIKTQAMRVLMQIINLIQKTILGDDKISNKLRMLLLQLIGIEFGSNTQMFGGCDVLGGNITIGDGVFINRCCYFDVTGSILIENQVTIGHGTTFITAHHLIGPSSNRGGHNLSGYNVPRNIVVKEGAWVAANATIMPGVTIGKGAVVAACALVTKDVPENTLVAGVPARVIKNLDDNIKEQIEE